MSEQAVSRTESADQVYAELEALYRAHCAGEIATNDRVRWERVTELIDWAARFVVARNVRNLYGTALRDQIEAASASVQRKFVARRLKGDSFVAILVTALRRDAWQGLRRSTSPSTVCFDGAEKTWESPVAIAHEDMFERIRARFVQPFRVYEAPLAREVMLSFLLSTGRYPGPDVLGAMGVDGPRRQRIYNAAVYSVNCAVHKVVSA